MKPDKFGQAVNLVTLSRDYGKQIDVRETGQVLEVGDGIARVYGLTGVMAGELIDFPCHFLK